MRTDDLIAHLSGDLEPVAPGALTRMLGLAVLLGLAGSAILMLATLGMRHDFAAAMTSCGIWMKLAYTLAIAVFGFWLVQRAGRAGRGHGPARPVLVLPVLVVALCWRRRSSPRRARTAPAWSWAIPAGSAPSW